MSDVPQVNPTNVPAGATIIDVREDYEWEAGHVAGAQHLVLNELPERLDELPKGEDFYVICHGGGRSTGQQSTCGRTGTRQTILREERPPGLRQTYPWIVKTGRIPPSFTNDAIS